MGEDSEIDGAPLSESGDIEDLDGVPLDGAALLKGALKHKIPVYKSLMNDDIDGVPCKLRVSILKKSHVFATLLINVSFEVDDDLDGIPLEEESTLQSKSQNPKFDRSAAFVPSRWESVDPEEAEAQAMTTSKWELLEQQQALSTTTSQDSQDSQPDVSDFQGDDGGDTK